MRPPIASLPWSAVAFAALLVASGGCSSTALPDLVTCAPPCPAGTHCEATGCVADHPVALPDLAAPDEAVGCGACAGVTPVCDRASGECVACLVDADCASGSVCRQLGVTHACVPGCSDDARCGGGSARCCGGACLDTGADPANCGGCGMACSTPHATSTCAGGQCQAGACLPPFGDCNHDPGDGCEAALDADPANCAACGTVCSFAHAIAGCAGGCYVRACDFGHDDCNGVTDDGCEKSLLADPLNCGACGASCPPLPHAKVACHNATCQLDTCDRGFADCDGKGANGCEAAVLGDKANCGQCGVACAPGNICVNGGCTCQQCNIPNARTRCVNLQCVFDGCADGWGDCNHDLKDGCEADLTGDAANCGACAMACPRQTPACSGGMCTDCLMSLANIGKADFTIAFTIQSAAKGTNTVAGQRGVCNASAMWEVRLTDGKLSWEFDDNVNYYAVATRTSVNDNNPHAIVAQRVNGLVTISVDGAPDASVNAPANYGALTPLYVEKGDPCEFKDGTVPLVGSVTGLCLTSP